MIICVLGLRQFWIQRYYSPNYVYLLVLMLVKRQTIGKVNSFDNLCAGSKSVLNTTLLFTQLRLFTVNSKVLGFKEQIIYKCAIMIWLTSFLKLSRNENYLANNQNMIETIAMFLVSRSNTPNPRHATKKSAEHTFG